MQKVNFFYQLIKKNPSSILNLIFLYRYSSLLITSSFYLMGAQPSFIFKVGVIVSLGVAAWLLTDLQRRYQENHSIIKMIVLIEIIGLTLLLIPTGGIASPFIWYVMNPVLVAASLLTPLFCWGTLTFYLASATVIGTSFFRIDNSVEVLEEQSFFYLVFLLTTLLASLFSGLIKELDSKANLLKVQQVELLQVNQKLMETNEKHQETLEHIMSMYHLMDNFSSNKSPEKVTRELAFSLIKCTQKEQAFFWLTDLNHEYSYLTNTTKNAKLETDLREEWNSLRKEKEAFIYMINKDLYLMKIIRTSSHLGVLGVMVSSSTEVQKSFLLNRTFEFLAELSEIMLERIYLDQMMDQMIIIEEQNRIANEIHDSVSQRLFGIVYSLHSLQVKSINISKEELDQEFLFLSQSANTTIKELRAAIYRLSTVKKGEQPFIVRLKKYLDDYAKLNDVKIYYQITGDESTISNKLKEGLYRIICEACGNSVRHGNCNVIELKLSILDGRTELAIQDDGIGIDFHPNIDGKEQGIGLINMKSIVSSFDGTFSIEGFNGLGTEVQINIPNINILKPEAVG